MTEVQMGTAEGGNAHEYTVSEISGALKRTVEDQFGYVRVRAELSGVKRAASGHLYFALKDDKAVIDGVCWRGNASKLVFVPEDGLEVVCSGKLTTYPARSKYQMVVDRMEPAGAGALMALLEERKRKLAAEGLFETNRKKQIPYIPTLIGVVTSPTGAVIRDILHRLADRFPRQVTVWPVAVQGEGAADKIAEAIKGFNQMSGVKRPDVLIVARGGGSVEDLWSFNEEAVVRAAAESEIPLISAVGHETDTTLIDYASDLRAPTPTGAAEMAVPVREDLIYTIADLGRRLAGLKGAMVQDRRDRLVGLSRGLPKPKELLGLASQRFDELAERLPRGLLNVTQQKTLTMNRLIGGLSLSRLTQMIGFQENRLQTSVARLLPSHQRKLKELASRLENTGRMLDSLSFERVLERGYVLIEGSDGKPVAKASDLALGDKVRARFADAAVAMQVLSDGNSVIDSDAKQNDPPKPKRQKAKKKPESDNRQGRLL